MVRVKPGVNSVMEAQLLRHSIAHAIPSAERQVCLRMVHSAVITQA